ncbi:MAG: hypothetical protein HFG34_03080 [Eubacterium sp.]|nr:hypothetical protein [Eubacterium sp.]
MMEEVQAKKNKKVIISVLDEFIEEPAVRKLHSARGALSEYADPALWGEEKSAWEKAVKEKQGDD